MTFAAIFLNILMVSAACGAVILILLIFMPLLRRRVAARSIHVIFLLLTLRLLIPLHDTFSNPMVTVQEPVISVALPDTAAGMEVEIENRFPVAEPEEREPLVTNVPKENTRRSISLSELAGAIWLGGLAVCLTGWTVMDGLSRWRLRKERRGAEGWEQCMLNEVAAELKIRRIPVLMHSPSVKSAMLLGIAKPVIFLPDLPGEEETLRFVLRHELTHHKRNDIAAKYLFSLACALHWFNPLVWLMRREANRNLELSCDETVVRKLSSAERRQYGSVLLDAAENTCAVIGSTSFGSGSAWLKQRLSGLFAQKKTSAALVCAVAVGIVLAGGLVACEDAEEAGTPSDSQMATAGTLPGAGVNNNSDSVPNETDEQQKSEKPDTAALLEEYFYQNYATDQCSVVPADLTGDGVDELIVISLDTTTSLRESNLSAAEFSSGGIDVLGVINGSTVRLFSESVSSSHVGWSYYSLCTLSDRSEALFLFTPYVAQGMAEYSCWLFRFDQTGELVTLDQNKVSFTLDPLSLMGDVVHSDSLETVKNFLAQVEEYQSNAIPLLAYDMGNAEEDGSYAAHFCYWNSDPTDVFHGKSHGSTAGEPRRLQYSTPSASMDAENAMVYLEQSIQKTEDGYVFRVPDLEGEWTLDVTAQLSTDGGRSYQAVHYLDDAVWEYGHRYELPLDLGLYGDLSIHATVHCADGTDCERTIHLNPTHIESCWYGTCQHSNHHSGQQGSHHHSTSGHHS